MDVVDLAKLAAGLPVELVRTRDLILSVLHLHSARSDVRVASDLSARASAMIDCPPAIEPEAYEDLILALTTSAIIYYAKATKSRSDHRRKFDIRAYFDEHQKAAHENLCKLRDDAVAHYGPAALPNGLRLRSDYLVVPIEGGPYVAVSRHTYGTSEFGRMLAEQTRAATLIMQRLLQEKEALLVPALNEVFASAELDAVRRISQVHLGDTIGDHEVARQLLAGPRVGHRRIVHTARTPPGS